ncbi:MAG: response regulator [Deltaproteobacteria bacterium]|nr:MAG: response regulator [Deltaproteobacteria bacterium]TMQ06966.1 MAG: response regulator [Deltaproteobacteria bacterium]
MEQRTILVVDDEDLVLRAFCRAPSHLCVVAAKTGAEAREIARARHLDAAVIDYMLGDGECGLDLVRELRRENALVKLVVASAYACTEMAVMAMRAGADYVKVKPLTPRAVVKWLETAAWDDNDPSETPSMERMQWEYVHRVLRESDGNISEAARRLRIERLTLRRHLGKPAPRH